MQGNRFGKRQFLRREGRGKRKVTDFTEITFFASSEARNQLPQYFRTTNLEKPPLHVKVLRLSLNFTPMIDDLKGYPIEH